MEVHGGVVDGRLGFFHVTRPPTSPLPTRCPQNPCTTKSGCVFKRWGGLLLLSWLNVVGDSHDNVVGLLIAVVVVAAAAAPLHGSC